MVKRHLLRLGFIAILGWLLGLVALGVKLTFGFSWMLALGLLVLLSLSRVTRRLGSESDESRSYPNSSPNT